MPLFGLSILLDSYRWCYIYFSQIFSSFSVTSVSVIKCRLFNLNFSQILSPIYGFGRSTLVLRLSKTLSYEIKSMFGFFITARELVYFLWLVTKFLWFLLLTRTFGGTITVSVLSVGFILNISPIFRRPERTFGEIGFSSILKSETFLLKDLAFFGLQIEIYTLSLWQK